MTDLPDGGQHRFGWGYYHCLAADETLLIWIVHEGDIYGRHAHPYQTLRLVQRGSLILDLHEPINSPVWIDDDGKLLCDGVEYRAGSVEWIVNVGDWRFNGELSLLGAAPTTIDLGSASDGSAAMHSWTIWAPLTSFTGTLELAGVRFELVGVGYHDTQKGCLPIQHLIKEWMWFTIGDENRAVVGLVTQHNDGDEERRHAVAVIKTGSAVAIGELANVDIRRSDPDSDKVELQASSVTLPWRMGLRCTASIIVRSRTDEVPGAIVRYRRWVADAQLVGRGWGWTGLGVMETFHVRDDGRGFDG